MGSLASVLLHAGAVFGVIKVCTGAIALSRDRAMLSLALPLYAYCAAFVVSFALNPVTLQDGRYLPSILIFLLFPFLYSSWAISQKATIAAAAALASATACYGAVGLAVLQSFVWGRWAEGGAGNATVFATVACLAGLTALAAAFAMPRSWTAPLLGGFLAAFIAILCSRSRTSAVALILGALIILWFYRTAIPATISRRLQIGVALAGAAILLLGLETIQLRLASLSVDWEKLVQHGDFQSSLGYRAGLWDIGLDRIAAHPLMGSGPQSTRGIISAGFADRYGLEVGFSHFHNGLLTAWVETGIAGAAALLALVAIVIRNALCTLRREASVNERFGAVLLLATVSTYSLHGATGLFIGHDILDSVLVALLTVGSFLSSGRPVDGRETADIHPAASEVTVSTRI